MNQYALDTMALVLYLEKRVIPGNIQTIFTSAENEEIGIFIPAMVVAEIGYLSEKSRIDANISLISNLMNANKSFQLAPLNFDALRRSFELTDIPELHDRLIAGTAVSMNIPLVTNDPIIVKSAHVETTW